MLKSFNPFLIFMLLCCFANLSFAQDQNNQQSPTVDQQIQELQSTVNQLQRQSQQQEQAQQQQQEEHNAYVRQQLQNIAQPKTPEEIEQAQQLREQQLREQQAQSKSQSRPQSQWIQKNPYADTQNPYAPKSDEQEQQQQQKQTPNIFGPGNVRSKQPVNIFD